MSKITSKNLHYDATPPPFLARLRTGRGASDGRHESPVLRPTKARSAEDEAEDEPVYVDEESGETFAKREWEAREDAETGGQTLDGGEGADGVKSDLGSREKRAGIGAGKKRKAAKVVGGGQDEEEAHDAPAEPAAVQKKDSTASNAGTPATTKTDRSKAGKKAKKVKLSFGDDE